MSILLVDIFEDFLGETRKHNDDTGQISFDCPACAEDKGLIGGDGKGNLEINYKRGVFRCWSCHDINNMHGPIEKLLKRYGTYRAKHDYEILKPDYSAFRTQNESYDDKPIVVKLPEGYKKLSECKPTDYKYAEAMYYLKKRGITDDIIREYEIGYTVKGKYFNRIIIPSRGESGEINYFVARWFSKEKTKVKYLNPDADKTEIIFNEGKLNWDATIYLVEGTTDHIVIPNSIPLLGKYVSDKLLQLLHDKAGSYIVIVLDGDAYEDMLSLYKKLNFGDLRGRIRVAVPSGELDPSKINELYGKQGIISLLKTARQIPESKLY